MLTDLDLCRITEYSYNHYTWTAGELSALFTVEQNTKIIAIPGTKREIGEWLRDIDAWPIFDVELGICHQGFCDGAFDLLYHMPLTYSEFSNVVITGHSLGGALAILLAALLSNLCCPPAAVVTFGAPRCASWRVRRLLRHIPLKLYCNGDDPVPEVPWLPGIYVHPRKLIHIGEPSLNIIEDHFITSYIQSLEDINAKVSA